MQNITVEHVAASACCGTPDVSDGRFPFLWVEGGLDVKGLKFPNITREETTYPTATLQIDKDARVDNLMLSDLHQINRLDTLLPFLRLEGGDQRAFDPTVDRKMSFYIIFRVIKEKYDRKERVR